MPHLANPPVISNLRTVDGALFWLMRYPNTWRLVDTWPHEWTPVPSNKYAYRTHSDIVIALRRKGADVRVKRFGDLMVAKARWTHAIPCREIQLLMSITDSDIRRWIYFGEEETP
jgi:hypothetical protein